MAVVAGAVPARGRIGGVPVLKGLVVYGATLTFAGLYAYFIVRISAARPGTPPAFNATLLTAASALAGVLGSGFALAVGTSSTSADGAGSGGRATYVRSLLGRVLSDDGGSPSWPQTLGIWIYAVVAAGVSITYVLNQNETPATIKALAVVFGGYVLALLKAEL